MADPKAEVLVPEIVCSSSGEDEGVDHLHRCKFAVGLGAGMHVALMDDRLIHECRVCGQRWMNPEEEPYEGAEAVKSRAATRDAWLRREW